MSELFGVGISAIHSFNNIFESGEFEEKVVCEEIAHTTQWDRFKDLFEHVRFIRSNECHIWLQITEIFAEISVGYDNGSPVTRERYTRRLKPNSPSSFRQKTSQRAMFYLIHWTVGRMFFPVQCPLFCDFNNIYTLNSARC